MYSPLVKSLLSTPVKGLGLPALIQPSDFGLFVREQELGWDSATDSVADLLFTLRINGVAVVFINEVLEVFGNKI